MELLLYILTELFLTAFFYLLIPTIITICYRNKKLSQKKIKRIAIINGICVWLVIMVIRIENGDESTNFSIFLWSWLSYLLMKHFCLEDNQTTEQPIPVSHSNPIDVPNKKIRYCSNCGNRIDPNTKICLGCRKQYSMGVNWEKLLKVLYVLITVLSLLLNVVLFVNINNGTTDYTELEEENKELRSELIEWKQKYNTAKESLEYYEDGYSDNENRLAFYDSVVVFVENDGTDYYHKYECNKFIGNDFWAYNVEYAEYLGYTACPKCYH